MKKFIFIIVLGIIQTAYSTIPGPPLIVECPKCGGEKRLLSLISGNTFGAMQWSDLYQYAPMLPRLSPVQKCPNCNGYFLLSQAKKCYEDDHKGHGETGRLTFEEIKEALSLLEDESLSKEDQFSIRFEFLHRYNDAFRAYVEDFYEDDTEIQFPERDEADVRLHQTNLRALIVLMDETNEKEIPLIAELYREAGMFEKCISLLDLYKPNSDYMNNIIIKMKEKAEEKNDMLFLIYDYD